MAKTTVHVDGFELETDRGSVELEVRLIRLPSSTVRLNDSPSALDIPADFRAALAEWLDTGNEV